MNTSTKLYADTSTLLSNHKGLPQLREDFYLPPKSPLYLSSPFPRELEGFCYPPKKLGANNISVE